MASALSQPPAVFHRRLCAMLLCLGTAVSALGEDRRERKDMAVPPPQPVPQEIKVERGQDAVIPLRIYGLRNQQLTFLIRKPPRTGRLGEVKNTNANAAIVHYRATDDRSVHSDVFEYAVKSFEGVSAAVAVQIEIIDQPPELFGPAEILYPAQLVGTTTVQTIELLNRGGMTAEGDCHVEPPWKLESPENYRVAPGGRLFAKVAFTPEKAGDFLGELRFSSQPDRSVVLRGIARDALAVNPPALRLTPEATTLVRAGVFEVTNNTDTAQIVRVTADKRLRCDVELRLSTGQTATVLVRTTAEDANPLNTDIVLQAGPHIAQVAVNAAPLPAIIRPIERTIDLGLVPGGTIGAGQFSLRNAGGVSGWATVSVLSPFHVTAQRLSLAPGDTVAVPITMDASAVGTIEQPLQVRTATETFTVTTRAIVVSPGTVPPRLSGSPSALPSSPDVAVPSTPMPANVHDLEFGRADPKQIVRTVALEPTRCVLEWHADLSDAPAFVAEKRELSIQGGALAVRWESFPAFKTERAGQQIRGTVDRLSPGHRYTLRVLAVGADGQRETQIFQTSIATPLDASRRGKLSILTTLGVLATGLAAFTLWRRNRPPEKPTRALKKTQRFV